MEATRHTLLARATSGSEVAWDELFGLYRPYLMRWLQSKGLPFHDAEELTQEIMGVLHRELDRFRHSGRDGAFRTWLKRIAFHRLQGFWRAQQTRERVCGVDDRLTTLELPDLYDELSAKWDREHDSYVLSALIVKISDGFEEKTIRAFRRVALEGSPPKQVADELGLTVRAVYVAKSRVLRRLRNEARGLIDDDRFDVGSEI